MTSTAPSMARHCLIVAGLLFFLVAPANADYRLQPGDILDLALIGSPEFHQRLPIEIDGTVAVPLVGQVKVSGLTLAETRQRLIGELSNKVYDPPAPRQTQRLILPSEIVITVSEYRPIYVSGYVAKPGGYAFRPGLTVRQAIALAGGFGPVQDPRMDAAAQISELRAEHHALSVEYAMEQDRIQRLRRELGVTQTQNGGVTETQTSAPNISPMTQPTLDQIQQSNANYIQARAVDRQKDKQSYQSAVEGTDLQIKTLIEKKKKDEEGVQADTQELDSVRELFHRGITANARLSEARRAAMLSSDQLLQTIVQISNIERQRSDYLRQIDKIDSQAKIDDWRDLQQANLRFAQVASRVKSVEDRLAALGVHDADRSKDLHLSVVRYADGQRSQIDGREDLSLEPGDVVTVTMTTPNVAQSGPAAYAADPGGDAQQPATR